VLDAAALDEVELVELAADVVVELVTDVVVEPVADVDVDVDVEPAADVVVEPAADVAVADVAVVQGLVLAGPFVDDDAHVPVAVAVRLAELLGEPEVGGGDGAGAGAGAGAGGCPAGVTEYVQALS